MLKEYPVATVLSGVGIVVGFFVPLVFLLALIPEVYLVTRKDPSVRQPASILLGVTLVLFVVMFLFWAYVGMG